MSKQDHRDEERAEGAQPVFLVASMVDRRPGDEALADAIRRELREDASTADLRVHVEVRGGIAFLRGRVDGPEDADNAAEVASRVRGVRQVVEHVAIPEL